MNNIFRMSVSACERWFSTVRLLMPSSRAISSLFIPDSRLILYIFCRCGGIFSTTIVTNSSSSLRWMVSSVLLLSCGMGHFQFLSGLIVLIGGKCLIKVQIYFLEMKR